MTNYFRAMKSSALFCLPFICIAVLLTAFIPINQPIVPGSFNSHLHPGKTRNPVSSQAANPFYIIVDKSDYELKVYDDEGWYATYPIVFGSRDLSDKMKEGDKKTPDG